MRNSLKPNIRLQTRIEAIMKSEAESLSILECFLRGGAYIYDKAVTIREKAYLSGMLKVNRLPCFVISIGNLTAGGTGKTPFAICIAKLLQGFGLKVCILSRGYKGGLEKKGGIVSNGRDILLHSDAAGDEPYLIADSLKDVPVIIGRDRYRSGCLAMNEFHPDVIVLDDAFQHLKLYRDLNIVLLDAQRPFGNRFLIPRGTLREPLNALNRGDAFVFTRSDSVTESVKKKNVSGLREIVGKKPVFHTMHVPYVKHVIPENLRLNDIADKKDAANPSFLKDLNVVAFSGIAHNEAFRQTLTGFGCNIIRFFEFGDHHAYSNQELNTIVSFAKEKNVLHIITTDKDYVKIRNRVTFSVNVVVIGIRIALREEEDRFHSFIEARLSQR